MGDSFLANGGRSTVYLANGGGYGVHAYKRFSDHVTCVARKKEFALQSEAREIDLSGKLGCFVVPDVFSHGEHGEGFCMEYVPGMVEDYCDYGADGDRALLVFATRVIMKILHFHEQGFVHSDLHSNNVGVWVCGCPAFMDWECAEWVDLVSYCPVHQSRDLIEMVSNMGYNFASLNVFRQSVIVGLLGELQAFIYDAKGCRKGAGCITRVREMTLSLGGIYEDCVGLVKG